MLVIIRALLLRVPVLVHPSFDVDAFERERDARYTSLVPTILTRLLDAGADLARFQAILVGGAPIPSALRARAETDGVRVVGTYGLTESCGGVVYEGVPLDGCEVRIAEADDEILLRTPTIMRGYRLDPNGTADALTPEGWLRTGDAGTLVEGRLAVRGRIDDLIITGGENVWPSEVEEALRPHPAVRDVIVIGQPDPSWGQRIVAIVIPADASAPPTLDDVRAFVAERLARYKAPHDLMLVDSFPTTAMGKVRRPSAR
jgi:O-succinylbenzoic acid--CoA ligase